MNAMHNRRAADRAPLTTLLCWAFWRAFYDVRRDVARLFS